jgi:protein-S-isoprenylcysteine O-methyltransferase Ste14
MPTQPRKMSPVFFVLNIILTSLFFPALILLLAGDACWPEGWLFAFWFVAMILSSMVYLYLKDPALLAERTRTPGSGNQKTWDKFLGVIIIILALSWLILMPLDARRFGWSPAFPIWLKIIGGLMLLPALFLIYRATADNTFLSTVARIQSERKQRVITGGVYGFVRHPLYLGCVLLQVGAPLLLGSLVGLGISLLGILTLIVRIFGEEKMMLEELEGYREYQKKVRYRLIPFIW